jgi:hypothetical protein
VYENRAMKPVKNWLKGEGEQEGVIEGVNLINYIIYVYGKMTKKHLHTINTC